MQNRLRAWLQYVFVALAVVLTVFQLYSTSGIAIFNSTLQRVAHLSLVLCLTFIFVPCNTKYGKEKPEPPLLTVIDIALACLAMGIAVFYFQNSNEIFDRFAYVDEVTPQQMFFGTALIVLVLEATRRAAGLPLVIVALCFIAYGLFGADLPGAFGHVPITPEAMIEQLFLLTEGIYGVAIGAAATMIFAFVLFGAFLEVSNMSSVFMDLSCVLTRKAKGGPAKVAIFASALFGTISGSAQANVYGTGIFTIPLMKKVGYSAPFAGAVEACASTGGQLMPPIMGAAAFIMADITQVGYLTIAKSALLPSILFYLSLYAMIHFEAVKHNIGTMPASEIPPLSSVTRRLYYLLPLAFLIVMMLLGRSVNFSAFAGCGVIFLLSLFREETRLTPRRLQKVAVTATRNTLMITCACACAGIVVGIISLTGGGFKLINILMSFVDGNLPLLLVMLMLTCFIVGMGVPTAPAYIIVSVLAAPAMIKLGVPMIGAHMFCLYYAVLSTITPPVCMAAFSAASIADANAMRTGFTAVKLGAIAFIIPFFFVYQPELLFQGSFPDIVMATVTAIVGVIGMTAGLQRQFLTGCGIVESALLFAGGLCCIYPGSRTDLIGLGLILGIGLFQYWRRLPRHGEPARAE
ncbi:MAG: TRAP transporter permease [Desulfovibrio sp.]|uniref:TRAP transporter permease n=1 Tax=Desulfovibrio sp. TaxID=885 RepID=UPI001A74EF8D|nr:TRAP transporter permease [Desulfovibrio sp.]MBD5418079.1 TRAP transporter permease [Desulfovibrio sp.]